MKKKILIFGGSGFFGKAFLSAIVDNPNYIITVIGRSNKFKKYNISYFSYHDLKKLDTSSLKFHFDIVFDFSSNVSVDDFVNLPQKMLINNIEIPIKNIKIVNDLKFEGVYNYISTDRAIFDIKNLNTLNEAKINNDPYGASKLFAELIGRYNFNLTNAKFSVIRFPNLYGPGQTSKQLIPSLLKKISQTKNGKISIGSMEGSRNYMFISDAVNALKLYIESEKYYENLCFSGKNEFIKDILKHIEIIYLTRYSKKINFIGKKNTFLRNSYKIPPEKLDDRIFRKDLKWQTNIGLKEGLNLTIGDFNNDKT